MASSIFHGKPGSYKTSTAVWFNILTALREGRFVVTNVEGLYSLDKIEEILGEKFPESAYLFRVSTLNETGIKIIAKWFHWLPLGALIVLDEIQNLYNAKERTEFNSLNTDRADTSIDRINDFQDLPDEVKYLSGKSLAEVVDDGYTDDVGTSERDANGHILYPQSLKDALMRHRKYNWDIIACTPDISQVHMLYRSVSEKAVSHRSFDFVPLPYFQRRPRTHEHNAVEKGIRPAKGESIKRRKIPVKVFSLYKSTQTGKNNKAGANENPFKNGSVLFKILFPLSVLFGFIFLSLYFSFSEQTPEVKQDGLSTLLTDVPAKSSRISNTGKGADVSANHRVNSVFDDAPDFLAQIQVNELFIVGHVQRSKYLGSVKLENGMVKSQTITSDYFVFSGQSSKGEISLNSDDLKMYGYQIKKISDCYVQINNRVRVIHSFCNPSFDRSEPDDIKPSLFAGQ